MPRFSRVRDAQGVSSGLAQNATSWNEVKTQPGAARPLRKSKIYVAVTPKKE